MTSLTSKIFPYSKKRLSVFERLAPSPYITYLAGIIVYIALNTSVEDRWQAIRPYVNEGRNMYGQEKFDEEINLVRLEYKRDAERLLSDLNDIARESYSF
jgi:hypothetical protein